MIIQPNQTERHTHVEKKLHETHSPQTRTHTQTSKLNKVPKSNNYAVASNYPSYICSDHQNA